MEMTADSVLEPVLCRPVSIELHTMPHATGSCLIQMGNTHVMCAVTYEERTPAFLKGTGKGWLTAEYNMLPCATHTRTKRESSRAGPSGRTQEIQRLIGRSLRACLDLTLLGEMQLTVDCDVLRADGGTRTAAITGGYVALHLALGRLIQAGRLRAARSPLIYQVAAISTGIVQGKPTLDLCYLEDSTAAVDANWVMTQHGSLIEVQMTAEQQPFSEAEYHAMFTLAKQGIQQLIGVQRQAIGQAACVLAPL